MESIVHHASTLVQEVNMPKSASLQLDLSDEDANMALDFSVISLGNHEPITTQLLEEREVPDKGIGVFATRSIASGTRVLSEAPFLSMSDEEDPLELYRTVSSLNDEAISQFWALAASTEPFEDDDWIDQLQSSCQDQDSFEALVRRHLRAMSIYETNRFVIRSPDCEIDRLGVFLNAARINHSCIPNVFHRYNPNIGHLTMHALRDINEGEEILTSYISVCHATAERRRVLLHWGFDCDCEICKADDRDQNMRRKKLEDLLSSIEEAGKADVVQSRSKADWKQLLSTLKEAMALMEEERMYESDTLGEIYGHVAMVVAALGHPENAKHWATQGLEVERKCCGEDSVEYAKAVALLKSLD